MKRYLEKGKRKEESGIGGDMEENRQELTRTT